MTNMDSMLRSAELISITAAQKYDVLLANSRSALERLATGTTWKSSWFAIVKLVSNLAPDTVEERLESVLLASSKREVLGRNVSEPAWRTYLTLARILGFSNRELRFAAGRNYVRSDGVVLVNMNRERFIAFTAWIAIATQALVCLVMIILLWAKFDVSQPFFFILIQVALFGIAMVIVLVMLLVFAYSIFLRGVLPLSVAHKLHSKQWKLALEGIPSQFVG